MRFDIAHEGENLHEISKFFFSEKKKNNKITKCHLLHILPRMLSGKSYMASYLFQYVTF